MADLTVGSLFSGIGGLDLGLERAGMRVIWNAEVDPYCCRVLKKHWPDVPNLGDVTAIDWSSVERPDVICGGYPCQPFSLAGARRGEADPRHLWPHMLDAIRVLRPRYALLENVPGHRSMGLGRVLGDLAESGYDTQWDCIPAAAVGAPHLRDRLFVVAYAERVQLRQQPVAVGRCRSASFVADDGTQEHVADASRVAEREPANQAVAVAARREAWTEPRRRSWWSSEPDVGRVADGVPSRVDRLRGLGNAVVPQVAEHVGRLLLDSYDLGTVDGVLVGVPDVSAYDIDDNVVHVADELVAAAVGTDSDGDGVFGHGSDDDSRLADVKDFLKESR